MFSLKKRRRLASFTIVEILVAITIIAILAGIYISINPPVTTEKALTNSLLLKLDLALENYKQANGEYPAPADSSNLYLKISDIVNHGNFGPEDINPEGGSSYFCDYFIDEGNNDKTKELRYVPNTLYYNSPYSSKANSSFRSNAVVKAFSCLVLTL
ncbi:MAG: prepilin-type N-terminal cleavage/methylation domain-containing protein, partial [Planctomycetes bacterium]|nr:prepilin-type N-terminal cleavage/methylation domain-containing protein [Planctomycetota bacterium]